MRVQVRFRVNTKTGEVEQFLIEDIGTEIEPDHDAVHDRIAFEVGKVVERRPAPEQVLPGTGTDMPPLTYVPGDELPADREREEAAE
jgi:FtsH ternary system domain X3